MHCSTRLIDANEQFVVIKADPIELISAAAEDLQVMRILPSRGERLATDWRKCCIEAHVALG